MQIIPHRKRHINLSKNAFHREYIPHLKPQALIPAEQEDYYVLYQWRTSEIVETTLFTIWDYFCFGNKRFTFIKALTFGFRLLAALICCSVKEKNNPNPSPIWKNWFGLYVFGGSNRTRTYPRNLNRRDSALRRSLVSVETAADEISATGSHRRLSAISVGAAGIADASTRCLLRLTRLGHFRFQRTAHRAAVSLAPLRPLCVIGSSLLSRIHKKTDPQGVCFLMWLK